MADNQILKLHSDGNLHVAHTPNHQNAYCGITFAPPFPIIKGGTVCAVCAVQFTVKELQDATN